MRRKGPKYLCERRGGSLKNLAKSQIESKFLRFRLQLVLLRGVCLWSLQQLLRRGFDYLSADEWQRGSGRGAEKRVRLFRLDPTCVVSRRTSFSVRRLSRALRVDTSTDGQSRWLSIGPWPSELRFSKTRSSSQNRGKGGRRTSCRPTQD